MNSSSKKVVIPGGVVEYIAGQPEEVRARLNAMRSAIQEVGSGKFE